MEYNIPSCPFCKSNNTELVTVFFSGSLYIVCKDCNAFGPTIKMSGDPNNLEKERLEAIQRWDIKKG